MEVLSVLEWDGKYFDLGMERRLGIESNSVMNSDSTWDGKCFNLRMGWKFCRSWDGKYVNLKMKNMSIL